MNCWNILIHVDAKLNKLFGLIWNIVLSKITIHVELFAKAFPSVRCSVLVDFEVTVKDLIYRFLLGDLKSVFVLGKHVD